jgi:hypothetical protein
VLGINLGMRLRYGMICVHRATDLVRSHMVILSNVCRQFLCTSISGERSMLTSVGTAPIPARAVLRGSETVIWPKLTKHSAEL